ncbi:Similar to S.cerevisiae protein MGM101 (Protein with a role in mitochondrial DNA recombinational repair) [Malassezia sympodialis ATCC 42132]|uniref:Mitochondrial genome maintenance protein MGM101 n=1 Tax=Malassezia sympodialis (strain ATCC 42132) TaxID=1230383 RepID=A0A1M8A286_MALS4|nr:Similar to S.cerevisiae protein MGM101 (Protein with a role in mitochondrial DNA recombinational repair) [Malassezia sympodialis ATCC 42132]
MSSIAMLLVRGSFRFSSTQSIRSRFLTSQAKGITKNTQSWAEKLATARSDASNGTRTTASSNSARHEMPEVQAPNPMNEKSNDSLSGRNWEAGFDGIGVKPFPAQVARVLSEPIDKEDVEIKPDGLLYLPEIKYRRILNRAFGPGGWGLAPQGEAEISQSILSREWILICLGRFVSTARGEQEFFRPTGIPTANEGAKSNALMRCCKDLGIASELWDPRFIRQFKAKYCVEVWCQTADGKKKRYWRRKDDEPFAYPNKEVGIVSR